MPFSTAPEYTLAHFYDRIQSGWLAAVPLNDLKRSIQRVETALDKMDKDTSKHPVLIAEKDPIAFITAFFITAARGIPVMLSNPQWGDHAWEEINQQIALSHIFGDIPTPNPHPSPRAKSHQALRGCILIPTGGTGGHLRFAVHTWDTLCNAAMANADFFGITTAQACCQLPLYHVSGLMQVIRTYTSGGKLLLRQRNSLPLPATDSIDGYQLSLVPTQLERLLTEPGGISWLRQFSVIYVGGGPMTPETWERAQAAQLPLALCYGTTETASMIAAQRPHDFLAGQPPALTPLPHAKVTIIDPQGHPLPAGKRGRICVQATSLHKCYLHDYLEISPPSNTTFDTQDEGWVDETGSLHIIGRIDRAIITGGEKADPLITEKNILASGLATAVKVVGLADPEWGEIVVCIYVAPNSVKSETIAHALKGKLPPHQIPKRWAQVDSLPSDEKGKLPPHTVAALFSC